MRILLIGANNTIREARCHLLRLNGYDAEGVAPELAEKHLSDTSFICLVLGSSLGEPLARELATLFLAPDSCRFIIRVAEYPVALDYQYAHLVVNPHNPAALLAALGAVKKRHETRRYA